MQLSREYIEKNLSKEKITAIESFIEQAIKEVDTPVLEEIKMILNRTFGEDNNQIVRPTVEGLVERASPHFNNSYSYMSSAAGVVQLMKNIGAFCIVVRFPEVTITNGNRKSHVIKNLFVRFGLMPDGKLGQSGLEGVRTTISKTEMNSGYMHSHLPGYSHEYIEKSYRGGGDSIISPNSTTTFAGFCLGEGPIIQAMTVCRIRYALGLFQLFCLHLKNFVAWESLDGTPYMHIQHIPAANINDRQTIPTMPDRLSFAIADNIAQCLFKNAEKYNLHTPNVIFGLLSFSDNSISVIQSDGVRTFLARIMKENEEFIFSNMKDSVQTAYCTKSRSGVWCTLRTDEREEEEVKVMPRTILTFKGTPMKLNIENVNNKKKESEKETIYAHPSIVLAFSIKISKLLTEKARAIRRIEVFGSTSRNVTENNEPNQVSVRPDTQG